MKTKLANHSYCSPSHVHIWNSDSLLIDQRSQEFSPGHHKPRQDCVSGDPAIRPNIKTMAKLLGSRGSNMLAWGKAHLPPKRTLSEEQCRLSYNNDTLPSNLLEPWNAISGQLPESLTYEKSIEQPSLRIHLSRSNDRLKACGCPSPEQGPLCVTPSVVTTITGGDAGFAAQKTNLPSRIMEWASGLEKQAVTMLHDRYALYVDTFTTKPCSNTSPSDLSLIEGVGVDRFTPKSSLKETAMTIRYSSMMTTDDELIPGATKKIISRRSTTSQPSDNDQVSMPPLLCSNDQGNRDRIEMLEARRDTLAGHKASIEKAIYDLTWGSGAYSDPYDMDAREEVKKTTAKLNSELADIKREERDVGLSLFRALKSQDEFYGGSGSSSLWVSRVTR
ncbi:hypothetical protein BDV10DRAFT_179464 [Aspergillus recurvatus]